MGRSLLSVIIYMFPMIVILQKYLELFASWSMSVVVSLLEDVYGVDAVRLSFFFMNGSTRCGTYLMAVFFVLGTGLRIPLLYFDGQRDRSRWLVVLEQCDYVDRSLAVHLSS
ncbi:hypothetical protein Droror1_Dr00008803 [Drosera rotundifolia]